MKNTIFLKPKIVTPMSLDQGQKSQKIFVIFWKNKKTKFQEKICYYARRHMWGRHGFDVGAEALGAFRGWYGDLVKNVPL
jgi:hypothetical protein